MNYREHLGDPLHTINELNLIKAIIFDLDGVIVDTAHYHYLAWKKLAEEFGFELTPDDNERLKGVSRIRSMEIVMELGRVTLSEEEKIAHANRKNEWFIEYIRSMKPDEVFPGVIALIEELRTSQFKVALASSSKNASMVLDILGIRELFDAIVDGTMITHSKPHPEIFLMAASRLGIDPSECLVFEDAEAGVEAALAAGMKCVGVGKAELLGKADCVIERTGDFRMELVPELMA